jgi:hypothetical protein
MFKQLKRVFIAVLVVSMVVCLIPLTAFASTNDVADDIKYTMDSDEALFFTKKDFNSECSDLTGKELDYVKFTLPDDDDGVLYYDYDEDKDTDEQTEVSATKKYYYSDSPALSKVAFVPDKDFTDDTLTIKYTGYDVDGNSFTGKIKITVSDKTSSDTITYKMDKNDDYVDFDDDDFDDVCDNIQDEDLDYVKFTLPDSDNGILYYDYDEDDDSNTKVSSSKKYYYEDDTPLIKKVTFVPDDDFSSSVTIKFTGYDVKGESFSGKVKITTESTSSSSDSSDGTVTYAIADNSKVVDFDEDDFNDASNDVNDEDLDYIKITIPSATKGILYYNYSNGNYSSIVSTGKKYYNDSSQYIKDITFVPNKSFNGICKIDFTGYDVKGDSFSGIISIKVGNTSSQTANVVKYTGKVNTATTFKDEDFNSVCKSLTGNQLDYVKFTLPSSSNGILYYGYNANGNYDSKVKASTAYYYGGSPYLLNVSFVPENNISSTVSIDYTGYDKDGQSYDGKVQITLSADGSAVITPTTSTAVLVKSKYFSDVDEAYSWVAPIIDNLYEAGVISGTTSGTGTKLYSPAAYVTRGDFIYLLYKAMGFKTSTTTTGFSDVPSNSYCYSAVLTAKALGIAQGSDNKFYPNDRITREDAMVMVLRAVNITGKTIPSGDISSLTKYSDGGSISDYSKSAVAALVKAGIITGSDDNKIYPQGNLSRAQIAAIIYRVRNL